MKQELHVSRSNKFLIGDDMNNRKCILVAILAITLICFVSCSKSDKGTDGNKDDGHSPSTIFDVAVKAVTDSTVTLAWTATGDDSTSGTASQYDIRYYRERITQANWNSATQVSGEPTPRPAGQTDSMVVTGLMQDSTYYFALIACDEAGNCSGLSNCVDASCITDIVVTFPDHNLDTIIRIIISRPSGSIFSRQLAAVVSIDGNGVGIANLSGLEYCSNLETIYMNGGLVSDLTPISGLTKLRNVQFYQNHISVISPMAGLVNLERIILRDNTVTDISALSGIDSLKILDLANNNVSDIAPLIANTGLAAGDTVHLDSDPLSQQSINTYIPELESRGVAVFR
jgi:hypothetical protein